MDLGNDNSATAVADNLATEPVETVNGTDATSGQGTEGTPANELFNGIDPKTLPPQAKAAYDSMLKDYRDKTGRLSETVKTEVEKAAAAYRQKAESYDQIATQEEFVKQWNEYVQKVSTKDQPNGASNPELSELKSKLDEMSQKMQFAELNQVTDSFANAVNEKGEKIHPDFDRLNEIQLGKIGQEDFSFLRACVELSSGKTPQERLANGYKAAKATYQSIFEEGRKSGMGRLQTKVLNGTNPPTIGSEGMPTTDKKPKNAHEAMQLARKGILVSRD